MRSGYLALRRAACGLLILLGFSAPPLCAATITVTSSADAMSTCPGPSCTLRQAIASSASGGTIDFAPGISLIELTITELVIGKSLTISGPGAKQLTVRRSAAAPPFRIFYVVSGNYDVTLSGLTIANGLSYSAAGILNLSLGTLTIDGCVLTGNSTSGGSGGGLWSNGVGATNTVIIKNSTIAGNTSGPYVNPGTALGAGISNNNGVMTITNSTFTGNSAIGVDNNGGGILHNSGTLTIVDSTIAGNSAYSGGGIKVVVGTVSLRNTIIAQNTGTNSAPDFDGPLTSQGYNLIGNASGATITGTTTGNQIGVDPLLDTLKDNGGPTPTLALLPCSPAIDKGHASGVATDQRGFARAVDSPLFPSAPGGDNADIGAFEVQGDQFPSSLVYTSADAGPGSLRYVIDHMCHGETITFSPNVQNAITLTSGELLIARPMTISGPGANLLTLERSAAGGTPEFRIFNIGPGVSAAISGITIANGSLNAQPGDQPGAGILVQAGAQLNLNAVTLAGNNTANEGGGLANAGTTTIVASTISGNGSYYCGGGIVNGAGTLNLVNSTISGNYSSYGGGGLCNSATANLTNTTIAGNFANDFGASCGGIAAFNGTVNLRNTLLAGNFGDVGAPDACGTLTSLGFNLIGNNADASIGPFQPSDQIGTPGSPIDPKLGDLLDNGGQTRTRALLAGSPALDKGYSSGSATDQRGFGRPYDLAATPNVGGGDGGDIGAYEHHDNVNLDVDANHSYEPHTDGLLILRYMFGITGNALTANAIGSMANRTMPAAIVQFLDGIRPTLDVDGNNVVDPLTDGVILMRYLSGWRSDGLTEGVLGARGWRTGGLLYGYLLSLIP